MTKTKCTVAVQKAGKTVKSFKAYAWNNGDNAKVIIFIKKGGTKEKLVKEYKKKSFALKCCMNAVIKYWPLFDPAVHTVTILSGHPEK